MNLSDLRRDFGKSKDIPDWPDEPFSLFGEWLQKAIEASVQEANAMILSTVGIDNRPSSRVVLLKEFSESAGFIFYTDYTSHKGRDIDINPYAAIVFYWNILERQIRIEGSVSKISQKISEAYFNSRPLESRLSAYVSHQSQPITNIAALEQQRIDLLNSGKDITCPERWGGYSLKPSKIEFWQGGANRLHHRMEYQKSEDGWMKQPLAP